RRTFLEDTAGIDIRSLGILADHREVQVLDADSFQRTQTFVKQPHRPDVRIEIQAESEREEYLRRMTLIRHARIADRSEQNGGEILPEYVERARRKRDAFFQIFLCPPVEFDEFQSGTEYFVHAAQHAHGLPRDIDADSISRYDCNSWHALIRLVKIR